MVFGIPASLATSTHSWELRLFFRNMTNQHPTQRAAFVKIIFRQAHEIISNTCDVLSPGNQLFMVWCRRDVVYCFVCAGQAVFKKEKGFFFRPVGSGLWHLNKSFLFLYTSSSLDTETTNSVSLFLQLGQRTQTTWTITSPWCGSGSWWDWRTLRRCSVWLVTGSGSSQRRLKRRYELMCCELNHSQGGRSKRYETWL